jgi:hypothetical protein
MPKWKVKKKEDTERYLKTKIIAILMLILASTIGLWFAELHYLAVVLWLIIILAGGYAIFEFEFFVSKVLIVVSALIMEFLVLEGAPDLLVLGSPTNIMLIVFGILDVVLIYSLIKLS